MAGNNLNTWITNSITTTGAEIRNTPGHVAQFLTGLLLFSFLGLDIYVAALNVMHQMRNPQTGHLATGSAIVAMLLALAIAGVIAWAVHGMLKRLPDTTWARWSIWMGAVALVAVMVQPILGVLQDPAAAGNSFEHDSATGMWLVAMTLARSPIYPLAAIASGVGLHLMDTALQRMRRGKLLKQDMIVAVEVLDQIAEGRQQVRRMPSELLAHDARLTDAGVSAVHAGLQQEADRLDSYLSGGAGTFDEAEWTRSIEVSISTHDPLAPELARVVALALPRPFPIDLLPEAACDLSPDARAEVATYVAWLRSHSQQNIRKSIEKDI